jgi:hypothetical protein
MLRSDDDVVMKAEKGITEDEFLEYKGMKGRAAHERKQLRKDKSIESITPSTLACLQRGILSDRKLSAGNLQPTRLKCTHVSEDMIEFVYANGRDVMNGQIHLGLDSADEANLKQGTQGVNISNIVKMKDIWTENLVITSCHQSEIQVH